MNETEIPMFDRGDYVKDKFGNIFKIITALAPQHFERDSFEYDEMGYQLELIEKAPNTRAREVGDDAVFHREGDEYWIYNTEADIQYGGHEVVPETIVATELVLFEKSEEAEDIEVSDVPIFLPGDLVKDAFGNIFEVAEAKPSRLLDPDRFDYCNMGYRLKLVTKNPQSPIREVHDNVKFVKEGIKFWVFNREEDARAVKEYNPYTITASELVLVRSVLQTKPATPATPATLAKAEITRRYPSIEDLQKMSEETDLGNLLDQAYTILKEQASLGERHSNLEADKFKRCIPHFEQEGFDVTEHGTLIEVSW